MNKLWWSIGFLLLVITFTQTLAGNHSHKMPDRIINTNAIDCEKAVTAPSLRCSRTPNASFDKKGRLWLTWVVGQHVYVNYSDDKGLSYSQAVKVNVLPENIAARGESRPKIVIDHQGRIFVSWTQKLKKRFSGHIRFSRSVDSGKSFSLPITVNDHREITSHRFESLAVNNKGDIYIAWLDKRDKQKMNRQGKPYHGSAVYYAISMDHGISFQANKKIVDHSCQCCRTAMAIDTDQLPAILWRHVFEGNIRDHALIKIKKSNPNDSTKPVKINRVTFDNWKIKGCPHHGPDISISDDGIYHFTWFNKTPEQHGLFYANSTNQGQHISTPISFGSYQAQASHPQVLSTGNKVYLAWQESDGKTSSLMVMTSSDSGKNWTAEKSLKQTKSTADYPILLSDAEDVYVIWHRPGHAYRPIAIEQQ